MAREVDSKRVKKLTSRKKKKGEPTDNSFKRLKNLEYFPEIDIKIKAGVDLDEIARWIQEDLMAMDDIQRESLKRQLYRYKSNLPPGELLEATEEPLYIRKAIEKMKRGVNEIEELEKLYLFQLRRISIDAQHEEKISKLFKGTNKEIELATNLLEKIIEKKMELGILDKQPSKHQVDGMFGHASIPLDDENIVDKDEENIRLRLGILSSKVIDAALSRKDGDEDSADTEQDRKDDGNIH